jgi:hypothetical protein
MTDHDKQTNEPEILDATVVPDPADPTDAPAPIPPAALRSGQAPPGGQDLAVRVAEPPALFLEDAQNPKKRLDVAVEYASAIADVIKRQRLAVRIGNKHHVEIAGWQVAGTICRVAVKIVDSGPVRNPVTGEPHVTEYEVHVKDYEWVAPAGGGKRQKRHKADRTYTVKGWDWWARAEARLPDGTLVGSSDSIVRRTEDKWAKDDDTALLGMAQTRASSRGYRSALGWIIDLAGYSTTPAEDMRGRRNTEERPPEAKPLPWWAAPADDEDKKRAVAALDFMLAQPSYESAEERARLVSTALSAIADLPSGEGEGTVGYVPTLTAKTLSIAARAVHSDRNPQRADDTAGAQPADTEAQTVNDSERAAREEAAQSTKSQPQQPDQESEAQAAADEQQNGSSVQGRQLGALMRTGGYEQKTVRALCELLFEVSGAEALEELELRQLCELLKTARIGATNDSHLRRATDAAAQQQDRPDARQRLRRWLVDRAAEDANRRAA